MNVTDVLPTTDVPRCAKCDMPVEEFIYDIVGNNIVFLAVCHGDSQVVSFTLEEFREFKGIAIGSAFCDPGY